MAKVPVIESAEFRIKIPGEDIPVLTTKDFTLIRDRANKLWADQKQPEPGFAVLVRALEYYLKAKYNVTAFTVAEKIEHDHVSRT